jgi:hypothetical protein
MLSLETRSEKENLIEDVSENLIPSGISSIKIPPFENVIIKNKLFFSFFTLFSYFSQKNF